MHRFFVDKEALADGQLQIEGAIARQICDVLRLKPREKIIALDNTGQQYTVELTEVTRRCIRGQIIDKCHCPNEPDVRITLFQGLTKRDKFEHILQKCTEVGVAGFVPIITERSIVRRSEKITDAKLQRRRAIITEAAEQAGRAVIPQLAEPLSLAEAAEKISDYDFLLVGCVKTMGLVPPYKNAMSLKQILRNEESAWAKAHPTNDVPIRVALFIGPEGGFSEQEIKLLESAGATAFSLGKTVMRTETAGPIISAIIIYELC